MQKGKLNVVNYINEIFPLIGFIKWFTIDTLYFFYKFSTHTTLNVFDNLGLGSILKHLFAPFRRDKTFAGYFIGITIRLVWTLVSSVFIAALFIFFIVLPVAYYGLPYYLYLQNPLFLLPYAFVIIVWYLIIRRRRAYWKRIETGVLSDRSVRKHIWKRLSLNPKDADAIYVSSVIQKDPSGLKAYLQKFRLNERDFISAKTWVLRELWNTRRWQYWRDEFFFRSEGVNRGWFAGFLPELKRYSVDLTEQASRGRLPEVFGREKEMETIITTLDRPSRNNVLIVGQAGVGKRSLVYEIAWFLLGDTSGVEIENIEALVKPLSGKRVIELNAAGLIGGSGTGNVEARLSRVLRELEAGETILFISQVENLINAGLIGYLSPLLASHTFPIIASTTPDIYRKYLQEFSEFISEFEVIFLSPPSVTETVRMLEHIVGNIENKKGVFFTYPALLEAVELSERYIHNAVLPSKAIHVLEQSIELKEGKTITISTIQKALSKVTGVPIGELSSQESEKLLTLETLLQEHIVGQNEAIRTISRAMRRARTGVSAQNRPIASFMFLGPTGVGKTLTAKVLAQVYFTPSTETVYSESLLTQMVEDNFVRFDMSEFSEFGAVTNFVERMTTEISERPFSLILLDEFEKAEHKIHNLFLQILEDGRLTNDSGQTADFRNTIIIATSNAVTDLKIDDERDNHVLRGKLEEKFPPELINRFDGLVMFDRLSKDNMNFVVKLELNKLKKRLLSQHEISLSWTDLLVSELGRLGYDEEYGARPLRRIIQDRLEDVLAQKILRKELQYGDSYILDVKDLNN
ncbi:ATP-dependent Clp protease ATP-binding subunit [bacterium]|uniref:Sigma-54 factor interaction domain-containing protein n=2 Tax=Katanobacteria TaxID=422282 RepID=A0A2M7X264_UNCKA|nr:ATP-dependent Clp protease ATP-binding subunit [bacterium]PIP56958.1 MAG: hypothetical protein COX05_00255 [candidate division WWE3 bacterium CG22_combo_CG10-13_8_21_14_all_39_12]PJA40228.1 MAG: hypothetical protein CO179_02865 [candidate division WWE3 bacterium CG_4_9_14_3_um_filter_39_7]